MRMRFFLSILTLCAGLSGCGPNVETRGYTLESNWKDWLKPGVTTKEDVMVQFGSPSTVSTFGDETWYYISTQRKNRAFLKPAITDQQVVRVVFGQDGVVQTVDNYTEADGKDFAIADRTTPTEGHQLTVVEQTLGNLGRFNSPSGNKAVRSARR